MNFYLKPPCNELKFKAAHMLQDDHHESASETSLNFTYISFVFEVFLLLAVECQGTEINGVAHALIITIARVHYDSN